MSRPPIEGTTGIILGKLAEVFKSANLPKSKSGYEYFMAQLKDASSNTCNICIVRLPNGYLIETDYPGQTNVYERLWLADPDLGRITYIESSNPDLKTKFDYFNIPLKDAESLEFHALPEDLNFLIVLLNHIPKRASSEISIKDFIMLQAIN